MLEAVTPLHLVILALAIINFVIAIFLIIRTVINQRVSVVAKIAWSVLLLCFPIVGIVIWLIAKPLSHARSPGTIPSSPGTGNSPA
ncbi:MAG: PLDc N-terminal domain-containing protein [Microbacteriaceae bacterium]|nr:PLDc N-terminal domain-containing protein [Microbacteriaceae bacterium]